MRNIKTPVLLVATIVLVALIWFSNSSYVVTVDISNIQAEKVVAGIGITTIKHDLKTSYDFFIQRSYDFELVLVGVGKRQLVYFGQDNNDNWYRAESKFDNPRVLSTVKEVEIVGQEMIVSYGKNKIEAVVLTFFTFLAFLFIFLFLVYLRPLF